MLNKSMKGFSPDGMLSPHMSPLDKIRSERGSTISLHDLPEVAEEHIEQKILQEMQERAKSRVEEPEVETGDDSYLYFQIYQVCLHNILLQLRSSFE